MYKPVASLVLKTSDLALNSDTEVGSCDTFNTNITWRNLNLRTILGDMYDKYDTFNLCLNSVSSGLANNTFGVDLGDRTVQLNLTGLPFINNTYDAIRKNNTSVATIGTFVYVRQQAPSFNYNNSNVVTFGKSQESCNFNIFYTRTALKNGSYGVNTVATFPDAVIIFNIFGIEKEVDSKNGTRF